MIGTTIGKYRIVGQLGRGGMGTVYKAVDETLDREVAIKVLNPELADTKIMKRFRAEATALAKLSHPEIATIYELFRSETELLIVMEFVRGETLEKICARLGAFAPERAAYVVDKILSALEHAHRAGIVHCDIKPANVMITEHGGVKIMDFGTARVRGAEHGSVDGYMMGTPAYMPPEQVLAQEVDGRADLYSVGVILYRLLTASLPFEADTTFGIVQKHVSEMPMPLRVHREGLADWCQPILDRALAKSPADRFQTAEEFRETLGRATGMVTTELTKAFSISVANLEPPPHPQTEVIERFVDPPTAPKTRRLSLGASLLLVGIIAALLGIFELQRPVPPAPATPVARTTPVATEGDRAPTSSPRAALPEPADRVVTSPTEPAPPVEPVKATRKAHATPLVFEARTLVRGGGQQRERKSRVVLGDDAVVVRATDNHSVLYNVRYDEVLSISYSHGRDPLWNAPAGPRRVARAGGGFLGIFVEHDWISLHTTNARAEFVVLRLDDDRQTRRATVALAERTGRRAEPVAQRND